MLRKGISSLHPLSRNRILSPNPTLNHRSIVAKTLQYNRAISRCTGPSLFSCTRCNLLHPQLVKLLLNGAVVLFQAFWVAYSKEAASSSTSTPEDVGSSPSSEIMSPAEALQILGIEQVNPRLLDEAKSSNTSSVLPLTHPRDIEVARKNFERMFAIAVKHDNMYLAGKFSAAYRLCVDPDWDVDVTTKATKNSSLNEKEKT